MIFENDGLALDLDAISKELVRGLPSELSDPYTPNRPWTKAVKDRLREMGNERGVKVHCHGSPGQGEWLLDVVWMVYERHEVVLAVESEWGDLAAIEDDFDKLMSIKARHKLLLFSTKKHQGAADIRKRIESNMRVYPYHLAGEEYMLLEVTDLGAFRYYFKVPSDGRLHDATFQSTDEPLPWPWKS